MPTARRTHRPSRLGVGRTPRANDRPKRATNPSVCSRTIELGEEGHGQSRNVRGVRPDGPDLGRADLSQVGHDREQSCAQGREQSVQGRGPGPQPGIGRRRKRPPPRPRREGGELHLRHEPVDGLKRGATGSGGQCGRPSSFPTLNEGTSIGHVLDTFRRRRRGRRTRRLFAKDPLDWEGRGRRRCLDRRDGGDRPQGGSAGRFPNPERGVRPGLPRTDFAAATGEVVATADGDSTYPVEEIPRLVRLLLDAPLDFITCDRLTKLDTNAMTREHRVGNWVLNYVSSGIAYHHYLRAGRAAPPSPTARAGCGCSGGRFSTGSPCTQGMGCRSARS